MRLIPDWVYWVAIGVLAAACGWQEVRVARAETHLAQEQQARSAETLARTNAALEHAKAITALTAQHAEDQQQKETRYATKIQALENDNRVGNATVVQLRLQLAAFAASGRRPGETDAAALERAADRLHVVSDLLAESIDLVTEGRGVIKRRDIEVENLLDQIRMDRTACSPQTQ